METSMIVDQVSENLKDLKITSEESADFTATRNELYGCVFDLLCNTADEILAAEETPEEKKFSVQALVLDMETEFEKMISDFLETYQLDSEEMPESDEEDDEVQKTFEPPPVPTPAQVSNFRQNKHVSRFCKYCRSNIDDRPQGHDTCYKCYLKLPRR